METLLVPNGAVNGGLCLSGRAPMHTTTPSATRGFSWLDGVFSTVFAPTSRMTITINNQRVRFPGEMALLFVAPAGTLQITCRTSLPRTADVVHTRLAAGCRSPCIVRAMFVTRDDGGSGQLEGGACRISPQGGAMPQKTETCSPLDPSTLDNWLFSRVNAPCLSFCG
jgi:hypothetical protein